MEQSGKIFLLNTDEQNSVKLGIYWWIGISIHTVNKLSDKSLSMLWSGGIKYNKVLLFLSDEALYMIKCGQVLNALCSKIIQVTYAAYGLHKMVEEVRSQYEPIDQHIFLTF